METPAVSDETAGVTFMFGYIQYTTDARRFADSAREEMRAYSSLKLSIAEKSFSQFIGIASFL